MNVYREKIHLTFPEEEIPDNIEGHSVAGEKKEGHFGLGGRCCLTQGPVTEVGPDHEGLQFEQAKQQGAHAEAKPQFPSPSMMANVLFLGHGMQAKGGEMQATEGRQS